MLRRLRPPAYGGHLTGGGLINANVRIFQHEHNLSAARVAVRKITASLLLLSHHDDRQTFHACRRQSRSTVWQAQLPKPPRAKFQKTSPERANPPRRNPPGQQEYRQRTCQQIHQERSTRVTWVRIATNKESLNLLIFTGKLVERTRARRKKIGSERKRSIHGNASA